MVDAGVRANEELLPLVIDVPAARAEKEGNRVVPPYRAAELAGGGEGHLAPAGIGGGSESIGLFDPGQRDRRVARWPRQLGGSQDVHPRVEFLETGDVGQLGTVRGQGPAGP